MRPPPLVGVRVRVPGRRERVHDDRRRPGPAVLRLELAEWIGIALRRRRVRGIPNLAVRLGGVHLRGDAAHLPARIRVGLAGAARAAAKAGAARLAASTPPPTATRRARPRHAVAGRAAPRPPPRRPSPRPRPPRLRRRIRRRPRPPDPRLPRPRSRRLRRRPAPRPPPPFRSRPRPLRPPRRRLRRHRRCRRPRRRCPRRPAPRRQRSRLRAKRPAPQGKQSNLGIWPPRDTCPRPPSEGLVYTSAPQRASTSSQGTGDHHRVRRWWGRRRGRPRVGGVLRFREHARPPLHRRQCGRRLRLDVDQVACPAQPVGIRSAVVCDRPTRPARPGGRTAVRSLAPAGRQGCSEEQVREPVRGVHVWHSLQDTFRASKRDRVGPALRSGRGPRHSRHRSLSGLGGRARAG